MTLEQIEARLAALEAEVARLKARVGEEEKQHWWKKWVGAFRGDPYYEEAMKLGRKYRESTRPKPRNSSAKKKK